MFNIISNLFKFVFFWCKMLYWTESYDQSFRNQITCKFILCLDHQKTLTTESNLVEIVRMAGLNISDIFNSVRNCTKIKLLSFTYGIFWVSWYYKDIDVTYKRNKELRINLATPVWHYHWNMVATKVGYKILAYN